MRPGWWTCRPSKARCAGVAILFGVGVLGGILLVRPRPSGGQAPSVPSRSTTIALTTDEQNLVVANRETNTVSVIQVRSFAGDAANKLAEVAVGRDPRCVAIRPNNTEAWVTNFGSGTVSVIALTPPI